MKSMEKVIIPIAEHGLYPRMTREVWENLPDVEHTPRHKLSVRAHVVVVSPGSTHFMHQVELLGRMGPWRGGESLCQVWSPFSEDYHGLYVFRLRMTRPPTPSFF